MKITSADLLRWSGLANLLAGLATAVFWILHPGLDDPQKALLVRWSAMYVVFVLLLVCFLWGVTGLYVRQLGKIGALGLAGYLLAFLGNAFFVGAGVFSAFVVPTLTRTASQLVAEQGPLLTGGLGKFFMLTGSTFLLGYVLFGIATFRAGVYPRWAAALLAVSAPVLGLSPVMPAPRAARRLHRLRRR